MSIDYTEHRRKANKAFHDAIVALAEAMGSLVQATKCFDNIPQIDECAEITKHEYIPPHDTLKKALTRAFYIWFRRHHKPP